MLYRKMEKFLKILNQYMKPAYGYVIHDIQILGNSVVLFTIEETDTSYNLTGRYKLLITLEDWTDFKISVLNDEGEICTEDAVKTTWELNNYTPEEIEQDKKEYQKILEE